MESFFTDYNIKSQMILEKRSEQMTTFYMGKMKGRKFVKPVGTKSNLSFSTRTHQRGRVPNKLPYKRMPMSHQSPEKFMRMREKFRKAYNMKLKTRAVEGKKPYLQTLKPIYREYIRADTKR